MGTSNFEIRSDDFVLDIIGTFTDYLKQTESIKKASELVEKDYLKEIEDADEGPLFWIALGEMQWTYGALDKKVLDKIKDDFANERGFERWAEQSGKDLLNRKKVIEKFITKLEHRNPKPARIPKTIVRPPVYKTGDCIAIKLKDNKYGAALVLTEEHDVVDAGKNLIAVLDYLSTVKPGLDIFKKRKWLMLTHNKWEGQLDIRYYTSYFWRKEKYRFEVVGNIPVTKKDPKTSLSYSNYSLLGYQVLAQKEWEKNHPESRQPMARLNIFNPRRLFKKLWN